MPGHTYENHKFLDHERLWLQAAASAQFDERSTHVDLWDRLPEGFDPHSIDHRFYLNGELTPLGYWHTHPTDPIFGIVDEVAFAIRDLIKEDPRIKQISAARLADRIEESADNVARALFLLVQLGAPCSASINRAARQAHTIGIDSDTSYKYYLRYKGVHAELENYYITRDSNGSSSMAIPNLNALDFGWSPQLSEISNSINPLIPSNFSHSIKWNDRTLRIKDIWEELQFHLDLNRHPNAVAVLFRVLLELSVEEYITRIEPPGVVKDDKLVAKVIAVAHDLNKRGVLDKKQFDEVKKFNRAETIISAATMNSYVHSPSFSPSPIHLKAIWGTLARFIVLCLTA